MRNFEMGKFRPVPVPVQMLFPPDTEVFTNAPCLDLNIVHTATINSIPIPSHPSICTVNLKTEKQKSTVFPSARD
jgi:hypothetical protein